METKLKQVLKYCDDIKSGKIPACIWIKKSTERFVSDLNNKDWKYFFDEEKFNEVVDFAESLTLPDIKQKLKLLDWQLFIYANLYGFYHKDEPDRRRFRGGYCEISRKNGKTSAILYPLILYDLLTEKAAESYLVSTTGELAEKSFIEIKEIINESPELKAVCVCHSKTITYGLSRITFYSADTKQTESTRVSLAILDEFHTYANDIILSSFRASGRARKNNLVLPITSAGLDVSSPCYQENLKAKRILSKTLTQDDYFAAIWCYDEKDDWKDPKNFKKANPSLGSFLKEDVLISDLNDALITPSHQANFKSKTCGIWSNGISTWIPLEKWQQAQQEIPLSELKNVPCFGGLDLSSINDISAFTLCWKFNGKFYFKHRFYVPEEQVFEKYKKDNINFLKWVEDGLIVAIPGPVIDYDFIYNDIVKDSQDFNIKEICFDRWHSNELIKKLDDSLGSKIDFIDFDQSLKNFSQPTKCYEKAILEQKIIDPSPVIFWMLSNVEIRPTEQNDYKPLKLGGKSSNKRIDGVITSIMAFDRATNQTETKRVSFSDLLNDF